MKIHYDIRNPWVWKALLFVRRCVLRFWDPVVGIKIQGRWIRGYLSTNYPVIVRDHPWMDTVLVRALRHARSGKDVMVIDVGANVGDTYALLDPATSARFLCVEGNPKFHKLLMENTSKARNVIVHCGFVGDRNSAVGAEVVTQAHGTSYLAPEGEAIGGKREPCVTVLTLDCLVSRYPGCRGVDLLKIDTDGYDYKVLRGARQTILGARPIIVFELSPPYIMAQGEDVLSVFRFLRELGYRKALFYDNTGYPLVELSTDAIREISGLVGYALISDKVYYDVVLFHGGEGDGFLEKEWANFPMRHSLVRGLGCYAG
jgi:FkbM family methyltransferase